jgi:hypothetical protein
MRKYSQDTIDLAKLILAWWDEHEYDTDKTGEYNTYEHVPLHVSKAMDILDLPNNYIGDNILHTS